MGKTAIEAKRGTFFWLSPSDPRLKLVGVDIRTGQTKPDGPEHYLYDPRVHRTIPEERLNNYRYYGIGTPVQVVVDGDDYLVEDGRGRTLGARLIEAQQRAAGESPTIMIKVLVDKGREEDLFGRSRALNIHDTDDTISNAKNAQRLLNMGGSMAKVATTFGVSEQTIRNWLDLLTVAPEVMAAVQAKELTPTAAVQLASVPKAQQAEVLATVKAEANGAKVTVERVQRAAREKTGKAPANTPTAKLSKIEAILRKLATDNQTKEALMGALDKISRVVTGTTLEKLGDAQ